MLVGFQISHCFGIGLVDNLRYQQGAARHLPRLVYENQQEIDKSPGKIAYTTTGLFTQKAIPFTLNHQHESAESMGEFLEDTVNTEHTHY